MKRQHAPPTWSGGYDEACAWLKYGAAPDWTVSLVRCWDTPAIELAVRVPDAAATGLEIPGYAPFSISAGVDGASVAIDGIGVLEQHPRRKVVFRAGDMDLDDPYALRVLRRWLAAATPPVAITIGQLALPLPADADTFGALQALASPQRAFRRAVTDHALYTPDDA